VYALIIDLTLHIGSIRTLEDVGVLGECCPPGRDSSLNVLILILVVGDVSLNQIDVDFNVLHLSGVDIYCIAIFSIT